MLTISFLDEDEINLDGDTVKYDIHNATLRIRYLDESSTLIWLYYPLSTIQYIKADFAEGISYV